LLGIPIADRKIWDTSPVLRLTALIVVNLPDSISKS
jgi:hypothetical protein